MVMGSHKRRYKSSPSQKYLREKNAGQTKYNQKLLAKKSRKTKPIQKALVKGERNSKTRKYTKRNGKSPNTCLIKFSACASPGVFQSVSHCWRERRATRKDDRPELPDGGGAWRHYDCAEEGRPTQAGRGAENQVHHHMLAAFETFVLSFSRPASLLFKTPGID